MPRPPPTAQPRHTRPVARMRARARAAAMLVVTSIVRFLVGGGSGARIRDPATAAPATHEQGAGASRERDDERSHGLPPVWKWCSFAADLSECQKQQRSKMPWPHTESSPHRSGAEHFLHGCRRHCLPSSGVASRRLRAIDRCHRIGVRTQASQDHAATAFRFTRCTDPWRMKGCAISFDIGAQVLALAYVHLHMWALPGRGACDTP